MKTRIEVARFVEQTPSGVAIPDRNLRNRRIASGIKSPHHYGLSELRQLLDFIYDGPPQTREEEVTGLYDQMRWKHDHSGE